MANIKVEHRDDGISIFTINRPERRNAISAQTAVDLQNAFQEFDKNNDQKVAIITGAGDKAFSAGADVDTLESLELWRCLPGFGIDTEKPIIAVVSGWCVGGGLVITMLSDLAVAADNTQFSYPEGRLGLTQGMIASLAARIPHKAAMEIMLLGLPMNAQRAYEVGLVNRVVPVGQQLEVAIEMAQYMCTLAPLVLKTLKRFAATVIAEGPTEQMVRTQAQIDTINKSADFQEGMNAFKEKRTPKFTGK